MPESVQSMTISQVMHALDNSTPYPWELPSNVLRYMAERMLDMTEMRKRPDHEVWQPEQDDELPVIEPMDPAILG